MVNSTLNFHPYRPEQHCALWLKSCSCRVRGKAPAGFSKVRISHSKSLQYSIKLLASDSVSIAFFFFSPGQREHFCVSHAFQSPPPCLQPNPQQHRRAAVLPAPNAAEQHYQSATAWWEMCIQHRNAECYGKFTPSENIIKIRTCINSDQI